MAIIYLDNLSATPLHPKVKEAMIQHLETVYGNPSTDNQVGQPAAAALEKARGQVASLLNAADPKEIVFTSGGTEANNHAIKGVAIGLREKGRHIPAGGLSRRATAAGGPAAVPGHGTGSAHALPRPGATPREDFAGRGGYGSRLQKSEAVTPDARRPPGSPGAFRIGVYIKYAALPANGSIAVSVVATRSLRLPQSFRESPTAPICKQRTSGSTISVKSGELPTWPITALIGTWREPGTGGPCAVWYR